jgi:predicted porin
MNRKLLAAAVAGAIGVPTAAMAEITVTGLLSPSINYVDTMQRGDADSSRVTLADNQSSVGFKWDEDLGAGTKFIGFIDLSIPIGLVDASGNQKTGITARDIYAGFDGGWGKIIIGDTSTAWKSSYATVDPLYRTSAQARSVIDQVSGLSSGDGKTNVFDGLPTDPNDPTSGANQVTRGRASNMIRYDTPSFGGLKGVAWVSLEGLTVNDAGDVLDGSGYGFSVHYETGPFFAGLDWLQDKGIGANGDKDMAFAVTGKWSPGPFGLWARYEWDGGAISVVEQLGAAIPVTGTTATQSGVGETSGADYVYAGVSYQLGTPVLFGTYGHRFESETEGLAGIGTVDNNDSLDAFLVAIAYPMSKRTWVYGGYGYNDVASGGRDVTPGRPGDFQVVTAGIKHSF